VPLFTQQWNFPHFSTLRRALSEAKTSLVTPHPLSYAFEIRNPVLSDVYFLMDAAVRALRSQDLAGDLLLLELKEVPLLL
jgi:hypothetical protein